MDEPFSNRLRELQNLLLRLRAQAMAEVGFQLFLTLCAAALGAGIGFYALGNPGLLAGATLGLAGVLGITDWAAAARAMDRDRFVLRLERSQGLGQGQLLSPLQIAESLLRGEPTGASSLIALALEEGCASARKLPRSIPAQGRRPRLARLAFLLACLGCGAIFLADPDGVYSLLMPNAGRGQGPAFRVWASRPIVAKGDSVQIFVRTLLPLEEPLFLSTAALSSPGAPWNSRPLTELAPPELQHRDFPLYVATLGPLTTPQKLFAFSGSQNSETLTLRVAERPRLLRFNAQVEPPAYLGQPKTQEERSDANLTVPEGSHVELQVEADQPLREASLRLEGQAPTPLPLSSRTSFRWASTPLKAMDFTFEIQSSDGLANLPIRYHLEPLPDRPPVARILKPGRDLTLDESLRTTLQISASDDHRIDRLELVYSIDQGPEQIQPLTIEPKDRLSLEYGWDLHALNLSFEQEVSYFVATWDNDTLHGPKRGVSATYKLRSPSFQEIFTQADQQQGQQIEGASNLLEKQKQLVEKLDQMASRMTPDETLDWKQSEDLRNLQKQQEELQSEIKDMAEQLREQAEKLEKEQLASKEVAQKMEEISKLFDQLADEDMQELMDKLQDALQNLNLSPEELEQLQKNMDRDKILQGLDRTLDLLKKLEAERKLEALSKLAENLAESQEKLAEQTEKLQQPTDPNEAEKLAQEQQKLGEEMKSLERQLEELPGTEALKPMEQQLDKMKSELGKPSEESKQAQEKLEQNSPPEASKIQRPLGKQLRKLSQSLSQMASQMQGMQRKEMLAQIEALVEEFAEATRRLDRLREKSVEMASLNRFSVLGTFERQDLAGIARETELGHQTAKALLERIIELGRKSTALAKTVGQQVETAKEELESAQESIENLSLGSAATSFLEARIQLHEAAVELLSLAEAISNGSPSASQSLRQGLEDLAEDQRRLSESLRQNKGSQGLLPLPVPRSPEEMASEQGRIRRQLEQLQKEFEKAQGGLGSLEGLENDMKDLEQKYQQGAKGPEIEEKQKKVLEKLLEAKKALRERKLDPQRESETAKKQMLPDQDGSPLVQEPLSRQLHGDLTDFESELAPEDRQLLEQYFLKLADEKP